MAAAYPYGTWQVTRDAEAGWWTAAQDYPDGGITTQAETWEALLAMMADAQQLWDADSALH